MVRNAASTWARSGRSDVGRTNLTRSRACTFEVIEIFPQSVCRSRASALLTCRCVLDARWEERFLNIGWRTEPFLHPQCPLIHQKRTLQFFAIAFQGATNTRPFILG